MSGDDWHVYPTGDVIEHITDSLEDCPCIPTAKPVERVDGSIGWIQLHHSLDGREKHE